MSKRKPKHTHNSKKLKTNMATPEEQKQFLTFYNANDFVKAQGYAERLTQRYQRDAFGWKVLGSCLHKNGHTKAAQEALERSLELNADDAQAQHLMARAWFDLGEPLTALQFAGKAVTLEPEFAQGHHTLAEILTESDQDDDALKHALKAEALGYNLSACLFIQSHIYLKRRKYQKAFDTASQLLEVEPDNAFVQNEMGNIYKDLGQFEEAEIFYKRALSLRPGLDTAFSNLIICMHYNPNVSADTIFSTIQKWGNHFNQEIAAYRHVPVSSDSNKTLRIGLVSPGFRMHPVGQMILTGLENLEPGFELHFYSTNNADDALTQRLKQIATRWNLVRHLDQITLAEQIYQDEIDILIDLSGFGEGSRLRTMSLKPAPLVIKWVGGLINTMGLPCFDYLISDQHETPDGSDKWYTEKLIRMPDDYICYLPAPDAPAIKALPAMTNGYITLGCFNNPAKINPQLLQEWAVLMHELPDSRLFLKSGQYENEEYCSRVRMLMYEQGIEPERLILEGPSKHKDLLDAYNRVDIALDTWPYSGGLTTCEAFMMGVPVVTFPGPTFAGRHSATHLLNAGMPELVVNSWDEYRQRVVELASDIPNLSVIRACLRRFILQSPVCDAEKFGSHFSKAMNIIWERFLSGKTPSTLEITQENIAIINGNIKKEDEQYPESINNIYNLPEDFKNRNIYAIDSNKISEISKNKKEKISIVMPCIDLELGKKTALILNARSNIDCSIYIIMDICKKGFIRIINEASEYVNSEYLVYTAQDAFPGMRWLEKAYKKIESSKKGLLGFNDGKWDGQIASFGLVRLDWTKKIYGKGVFFAEYNSHCADDELTLIAQLLDEYVYDPNSSLIEVDYNKHLSGGGNIADRELLKKRVVELKDRYTNTEHVYGDAPKHEILKKFHSELAPDFYLEIGVQTGKSLSLSRCESIGIDPDPIISFPLDKKSEVYPITSDNFFEKYTYRLSDKKVDLSFIDGMHLMEYALRDFINVEKHSKPSTLIVIDDIFPGHPLQASRERKTSNWTGDVWKLFEILKEYRKDLYIQSINAHPTGLLLISGLDPKSRILEENYDGIINRYMKDIDIPKDYISRKNAWSCHDHRISEIIKTLKEHSTTHHLSKILKENF